MTPDDTIQDLAISIYEAPLDRVRDEDSYPDLSNPLHLVILLIDSDTEIQMNSIFGFLENSTGEYLSKTIEALELIGSPKCASIFRSIEDCMKKHKITWKLLRADFEGTDEYQITSFSDMHGDKMVNFSDEVCDLAKDLELFSSPEDAYSFLCLFLEDNVELLNNEIKKRKA